MEEEHKGFDKNLILIKLVKSYPNLYNKKNDHHKNNVYSENAWKEITAIYSSISTESESGEFQILIIINYYEYYNYK